MSTGKVMLIAVVAGATCAAGTSPGKNSMPRWAESILRTVPFELSIVAVVEGQTHHVSILGETHVMTTSCGAWMTFGRSRVRESRTLASGRAKSEWLDYSTANRQDLTACANTYYRLQ